MRLERPNFLDRFCSRWGGSSVDHPFILASGFIVITPLQPAIEATFNVSTSTLRFGRFKSAFRHHEVDGLFISRIADAAGDAGVSLRPSILLAHRTSELRLAAAFLGFSVFDFFWRLPFEEEARRLKSFVGDLVQSTVPDVVRHVLSGLLATDMTSVRRHQTNGLHLGRPLLVMVASTR